MSAPASRATSPSISAASLGRVALALLVLVATGAVAGQAAQTAFSAVKDGEVVVFNYAFMGRDGATHRLGFGVPSADIEAARRGFRAHNPAELLRLANAEQRRLLQAAVDALAETYPQAEVRLEKDGVIRWRVVAGADAADEQRRLFDRLMAEEIARLRAEYPRVEIRASAGSYQVRAERQVDLDEVGRRLRQGEERAAEAVRRLADEQRTGVERRSVALGEDLRSRVAEVEREMAELEATYYEERLYKLYEDRSLRPDYARIARESVGPLAPVAAALEASARGLTQRMRIERLLLFLQTIPYDRLQDRATDAGFSPPLVVLADNRGDCDSKAVAFAALVHRLYPELPVSLVLVPGHALVALGIRAESGDRTLKHAGRTWVLAEPVGPGAYPIGKVAEESARALRQIEALVALFP